MIEGAGKSLAMKGRGVWGDGEPRATGRWELQAGPVVQSSTEVEFWAVFF